MLTLSPHIGIAHNNGELYNILRQLQNLSVLTAGTVYYVHKDGNSVDGLSWETAYTTIAAAITVSNATIDWTGNEEDNVIVIAPGTYAESLTTPPYYCHMIGLGVGTLANSGMSVRIEPASGVALSGTLLGLHLHNIAFVSVGAVDIIDGEIVNDCLFERCMFAPGDGDVVNMISTNTSDGLNIIGCKFKSGLGGGAGATRAILFQGGADKYWHNGIIRDCIIAGLDATGTGIKIEVDCTATESIIKNNIIRLSGAGVGIDDDNDNVIVQGNTVYHIGGDAYDINVKLASQNIDNNNGTVVDEPNMG